MQPCAEQRSTARTEIAELPVPVTALQRQELKSNLLSLLWLFLMPEERSRPSGHDAVSGASVSENRQAFALAARRDLPSVPRRCACKCRTSWRKLMQRLLRQLVRHPLSRRRKAFSVPCRFGHLHEGVHHLLSAGDGSSGSLGFSRPVESLERRRDYERKGDERGLWLTGVT